MTRKTENHRGATPRRAVWAVVLLLVLGAPALAGASDGLPESGRIDARPAERVVSGFEGLWHALADAWHGLVSIVAAEAGDGSDPDESIVPDPCDLGCPERHVDLDPDG